jgi:RHS repeat-associated protein
MSRGRFWLVQSLVAAAFLGAYLAVAPLLGGTGNGVAHADAPVRHEIVGARTATSETWANTDGTYTTTVFPSPVNYRDASGHWLPIDSHFVATTGTSPFAFRNAANSFASHFASQLGDDFLQLEIGGDRYHLTLLGARHAQGHLHGSSLVYPNALPDANLRYDLLADGVEETVVLGGRSAPAAYDFELSTPAGLQLTPELQRDGSWTFAGGKNGNVLFTLAAPVATDAGSGGAEDPSFGGRHAWLTVRPDAAGFRVGLHVDARWLHSPDRVFPVSVDPTIVIQHGTGEEESDANYDAACGTCALSGPTRLSIGTTASQAWRAALEFDLSQIPPGAHVTGAQLQLYYDKVCIDPTCPTAAQQFDVYPLSAYWQRTDSTTATMHLSGSSPLASTTLPGGGDTRWLTWDLTPSVRGWLTGDVPNYGVVVRKTDEALGHGGVMVPSGTYSASTALRPELSVTYAGDGVDLAAPDTLHSNGADLSWTPYTGPGASPFVDYKVYRSTVSNFTPSAATLVATIQDPDVITYRDTTAAPGGTFTYEVTRNDVASQQRTVTLPSDGNAQKTLQPGPADGEATTVMSVANQTSCAVRGAYSHAWVGTNASSVRRTLVRFDLRDVPANATVSDATVSLWESDVLRGSGTVSAHQVTSDWSEGTGINTCTGDGASWYDRRAGDVGWTTPGGDFQTASIDSIAKHAGDQPRWDSWHLTPLVRQWLNGGAPNLGILLKLDDESYSACTTVTNCNYWGYISDDYGVAPALRPKLTVTYADGSHAQGPTVAMATPTAGDTVSGTTTLAAGASDDGHVARVDFYLDGSSTPVASATAAPWSANLDTTSLSFGSHTLDAVATDDAGNTTTSTSVTFSVDNSAAPTVSLSGPLDGTTVSGSVPVTATAADDHAVTHVELYVDDSRFADVANAPYTASLDTTSAIAPVYDGQHVITAKAYDAGGHVTTSAPVTITVANAPAGSEYSADINATTPPDSVVYDPNASTQDQTGEQVTLTNTSSVAWSASDVSVRYRWIPSDPGGTAVDGPTTPLTSDVPAGQSQTLTVLVSPPALPDGVDRSEYMLRLDLWDRAHGHWFSDEGSKPWENPVLVDLALQRDAIGLERYYHYVGAQLGAGMQQLTNVANGNSIVRWTPFNEPGTGLATVVDLTYNSLESTCDGPPGNNWLVSISSLVPLGSRLEVHPDEPDGYAHRTARYIDFTDADGTPHRFTDSNGDGYWDAPPGVHLYLRQYSTSDSSRTWALTRPDGVTFFFDRKGYPTYVSDRNGNTVTFTEASVSHGDYEWGSAEEQVTKVTDAGGRSFTITYYGKHDAIKARLRGKIKSITDHLGRTILFSYYYDGNLLRITQKGGTNADGSYLADRSFVFTYTNSSGSGPAIPNAADRVNPDPHTYDESSRLYSVRDPRGNETTFSYLGPTRGLDRWKLGTLTDRSGSQTTFSYDDVHRTTTVAEPLSRTWTYGYDADGKVTTTTNPLSQTETVTWTGDRAVSTVTEPSGAVTSYAYNANGYLTSTTDALGNKTQLTYQDIAVDGNDTGSHWESGRTIPHISQLLTLTKPKGVAAGSGYQTQFGYDSAGDVTSVGDALGNVTHNTYNANGTLATTTDPNNHTTSFGSYDANGLPGSVTDPLGHVNVFTYDAAGDVVSLQDANHASSTGGNPATYEDRFYYDSFGRLGRQSSPKSTRFEPGTLIWTDATYDANDNVTSQLSPHYGTSDGGDGPLTTVQYDAMDRPTLVTGPDKSVDPAGERVRYAYDPAGRLTDATPPNGARSGVANAFATHTDYDLLDRPLALTQYPADGSSSGARITHYCYDLAGDLRSTTAPNGASTFTGCPAATTPYTPSANPYTTVTSYDAVHRPLSQTDPLGRTQVVTYDLDGNVATATDAQGVKTTTVYDQLDRAVKQIQPFDTTVSPERDAVTVLTYDPAGNLATAVSPRGYDASSNKQTFTDYVTTFHYDAADQLVRTDDPTAAGSTALYEYRGYDPNGNLTAVSQPTPTAMAPNAVDFSQIPATQKTTTTYFDPGWVRTEADPGGPSLQYDYAAEGWQTLRVPLDSSGGQVTTQQMLWNYSPDGRLLKATDPRGLYSVYAYDANGNLVSADEGQGVYDASQANVDVNASYDGFNDPLSVAEKLKFETNFRVTHYAYDGNGNVTSLVQNQQETPSGSVVVPGDAQTFAYDKADQNTTQVDQGTTPSDPSDDQRITQTFTANGWPATQLIEHGIAGGGWSSRQTTATTYFANGLQKTLVTKNGSGATLESHTLGYLDSAGRLADGNITSDTFSLQGPSNTACRSSSCTATYAYDPLDRLTTFGNGRGSSTAYTLDPAGDVTKQVVTSGSSTQTTTFGYTGTRLSSETDPGGLQTSFFYDTLGNLTCATQQGGTASDCNSVSTGGTVSPNVLASYGYDELNRLSQIHTYDRSGGVAFDTGYTYDAFDRPVRETSQYQSSPQQRTLFEYLGISNQTSLETNLNSSGVAQSSRSYSYDGFGDRVSMLDTNLQTGSSTPYTFGYDAGGSISLLVQASGSAKASYGYTPYGLEDAGLSSGDSAGPGSTPVNPYRFMAKRFDTGSGTLDMGARRYGPDTAHFLQQDEYSGALDDLGLSQDPLTENRYSLTGANPVNFVEVDGHASVGIGLKQSVLLNNTLAAWNRFMDVCFPHPDDPRGVMQCNGAMQTEGKAYHDFLASYAPAVSWLDLIKGVTGVTDFLSCSHGSASGCLWSAAMILPVGRIGKLLHGAVDIARARRALEAGTSIWSASVHDRGVAIEESLGFNMSAQNFPVIDRWVQATGTATSIKSINLLDKTYRSGAGILSKLKRDINSLERFSGRTWKGQTVDAEDIKTRRLLVALPPVVPSPDQLVGMARAWRYARAHGVQLRFTVVG